MDSIERDEWWNEHFRRASSDDQFDYISHDGNVVVELQQRPQGLRGLYAGVMRLALAVERERTLNQACLVIDSTRISLTRLQKEWQAIRNALRHDVSDKLSIVALRADNSWIDPDEPLIEGIRASFLRSMFRGDQDRLILLKPAARQRYFEIVKVLVIRWLRREEPIAIGRLATQVGCSYPTLRQALARLESKKYLKRESGRTVRLTRFPSEAWQELVALTPSMRPPIRFVDASGERPNIDRLMDRLRQLHPKRIAFGGVVAARHWHADFDLHGTPRIDLVVHAPDGVADLRFLNRLDPALKENVDPDASPTVVIHALVRRASSFAEGEPHELPFADPVETVLDLHELGLSQQANQLLTRFRREVRQL